MATLDLSDAQKEKVKAIFVSHKEDGQAFREQCAGDRAALKAAASAANPDPAVVGAAFLKVRADGEAAKAKMKAVKAEIDAVLTPGAAREVRGLDRRPQPAAARDARRPRRAAGGTDPTASPIA